MNTHTHVLLALSLVGSAAVTLKIRMNKASDVPVNSGLSNVWTTSFIIFGALLPDISLFVMFGYAQLTGVPNDVIWSDMYYSNFWQNLGAITNSVPIFLLTAILSWLILYRSQQPDNSETGYSKDRPGFTPELKMVFTLLVVSLAALLHVAADLPLHHDDGHPHFWPLTNWIFVSPVSYWDSSHYANYWVPVECILGLTLVAFLFKKTQLRWVKGLLLFAGLSYPVFALLYFSWT